MSNMHNPPHPGAFIREVSPFTFNRLVMGKGSISPEMARCLSKAFGRSPENWLTMQDYYNLWQARSRVSMDEVKRMAFG